MANNILRIAKRMTTLVTAAAMASVVTYYVCDSINDEEVAELKGRIKELQKISDEAKVTQRISEQMEDIAFQQKIISDKQLTEAENQKKIADMERGKAELERGLAQAAERKALASAKEAEEMRIIADEQREEAVKSMKAAELAQAKTDTLYYLSVGESLAQTATAFGNNVNDMSRLLAYASWYFTSQYGGNVNGENIFKALLFNSSNFDRVNTNLQGNVRAIKVVTIDGGQWAISVTDHGEFFCGNTEKLQGMSMRAGYYYRDLDVIDDKYCATITADGIVNTIDYTAMLKDDPVVSMQKQLPKGNWRKIFFQKEQNVLICLSDANIAWLDAKTLETKAEKHIDGNPMTIGYGNGLVHIFGNNNTHYITEEPGVLARMPLNKIDKQVTCYHYVNRYQYHVLGTEDGAIYIANNDGEIIHTLTGHEGAITDMVDNGPYLLSISYDSRLRLWDLSVATSIVSRVMGGFDKWPLTFAIDYTKDMLWIGNADGHINRLCIDVNANARNVQSLLTRDFTKPEWDRYLGPHIPFRSFMIRKEEETKEGGKK